MQHLSPALHRLPRRRGRPAAALLTAALLLLSTAPSAARAADEAPPTDESTLVIGEPEADLAGRWMLIAHEQHPGGPQTSRTSVEFLEIAGAGSSMELRQIRRQLPGRLQRELERANQERRHWEPSEADFLKILREQDELPADPRGIFHNRYRVITRDRFPDALGSWVNSEPDPMRLGGEASLAIEVKHAFEQDKSRPPKAGELMADVALYKIHEIQPDLVTGEHTRTLLAAAMLPIPATLQGSFRLQRLDVAVPEPSLRDRVADMWSEIVSLWE